MSKDPFQYIFRFCCDPGFNDQQEIDAMVRFADEASIDDVALFCNVEELNTGHMSYTEQEVFLELIQRLQSRLCHKDITVSVNQWHTLMPGDIGIPFGPDQNFRPMVDKNGTKTIQCVCPLCTEWQEYIGQIYARYAKLNPFILWVDDDMRLHNHAPLEWGGCFCDEHMKRYSELAGKEITREEFVAGILKPGKPHPYRKIWLDVARDSLLSACEAINRAVRAVSDNPRIGLMSSDPFVHAAEGRDWHKILYTLGAGNVPVNRIHLPAYYEDLPHRYLTAFNMISMMNRDMIPPETEVYPELENFPYGLFSNSHNFTRFKLLSAMPLNLSGITVDLYDLSGNGIVWEENYQETLRETKPYLNLLTEMGVFRGDARGVRVLYNPQSSYTLHTIQGTSMEELYPHECFWAGLLPAFGIPYRYCDYIPKQEIVAVSGQVLRNYDVNQLQRLFYDNFVILSGDAAWTLFDMGMGHLAGIQDAHWIPQYDGTFTFEEVTNGKQYRNRPHARASIIFGGSDVLNIQYLDSAQVYEYTSCYNAFHQRTLPAQTVVNQRVMIYPFGRFGGYPTTIPCMLWNALRQELLQDIVSSAGATFPMVKDSPYLEPHYLETKEGNYLYLINGSMDSVEQVRLILPNIETLPQTLEAYSPHLPYNLLLSWKATKYGIEIPVSIPSMDVLLIKLN